MVRQPHKIDPRLAFFTGTAFESITRRTLGLVINYVAPNITGKSL